MNLTFSELSNTMLETLQEAFLARPSVNSVVRVFRLPAIGQIECKARYELEDGVVTRIVRTWKINGRPSADLHVMKAMRKGRA